MDFFLFAAVIKKLVLPFVIGNSGLPKKKHILSYELVEVNKLSQFTEGGGLSSVSTTMRL